MRELYTVLGVTDKFKFSDDSVCEILVTKLSVGASDLQNPSKSQMW